VWLWGLGSLTALLTALYMFRLLWLVFLGRSRMEPEVEQHVHESPLSMTGVLVVLAVFSVIAGWFALPHYLEPLLPLPALRRFGASAHGRRSSSRWRWRCSAWSGPRGSTATGAPAG
jgi:NADH:ubiquinone oxidoreductase subunit 5 (subunit L)/multisubunit Na+/H+ antiporter MnhA subunit